MKRSVMWVSLLSATFGWTGPSCLHAGIIAHHGSVSVSPGDPWSDSGPNSAFVAAAGPVIADDGTGHGPTIYTYDLAASAVGQPGQYSWALKNFSHISSTQVDVLGAGFSGESKANWMDLVTVTGGADAFVTLRFSFHATGFSSVGWYDTNYFGGGYVSHIAGVYVDDSPLKVWDSSFSVQGRPGEAAQIGWSSTFDGPGYDWSGSFSGGGSFDMTFAMSADESGMLTGTKGYTMFSNLWANTINGFATGDFYGTTVLSSITLLDGSTPESRGYSLSFDSGLRSPNLAPTSVTPEPTSLALAGFAGLGMAVGAWRRRRQVASRAA